MKAVVTGVNGYLGRHMARHLAEQGVRVIGTDRAAEPAHPVERYVAGDLSEPGFWTPDLLDADLILFLAGLTGTTASIDRADAFVSANETSLARLLVALAGVGFRPRIIFPSTRLVYDGAPGPLPESHRAAFKTVYSLNKFACERLLELFAAHHGIDYTVFRICVPYGNLLDDRYSYGTVGFLLDQAQAAGRIRLYGGGRQRRTFTHVADVCELMWDAVRVQGSARQTFNIGGEDLSLAEAAAQVAAVTGAVIEEVAWPPRELQVESGDTVFDASRLEALLGRGPRRRFAEWLRAWTPRGRGADAPGRA